MPLSPQIYFLNYFYIYIIKRINLFFLSILLLRLEVHLKMAENTNNKKNNKGNNKKNDKKNNSTNE